MDLDKSQTLPIQTVFFRQDSDANLITMPPCQNFMTEFSNALAGSIVPRRRSKTTRALASMAEADSIGIVRCPGALSGRPDSLL